MGSFVGFPWELIIGHSFSNALRIRILRLVDRFETHDLFELGDFSEKVAHCGVKASSFHIISVGKNKDKIGCQEENIQGLFGVFFFRILFVYGECLRFAHFGPFVSK